MNQKKVFIIIILALFVGNTLFVPSTSAISGDESPQSIKGLSKTIPNDTLFYPNSLDFYAYDYSYTLQDFDGESGDITDTYANDSSVHAIFWSVTDVGEWWKYSYYKIDNQSLGVHHIDLCFNPDSCTNYSVSYWNGAEYVEYINETAIGLVSITDWELEADVLIIRLGVYYNKTSPLGTWIPSIQVDYIHDQFTAWYEVTEATFNIQVPFDYWAFNVGLIFFGLILVISSTCIFAVWIRNKSISRDKFFIFLVLFMLGWGLFLGGEMLS